MRIATRGLSTQALSPKETRISKKNQMLTLSGGGGVKQALRRVPHVHRGSGKAEISAQNVYLSDDPALHLCHRQRVRYPALRPCEGDFSRDATATGVLPPPRQEESWGLICPIWRLGRPLKLLDHFARMRPPYPRRSSRRETRPFVPPMGRGSAEPSNSPSTATRSSAVPPMEPRRPGSQIGGRIMSTYVHAPRPDGMRDPAANTRLGLSIVAISRPHRYLLELLDWAKNHHPPEGSHIKSSHPISIIPSLVAFRAKVCTICPLETGQNLARRCLAFHADADWGQRSAPPGLNTFPRPPGTDGAALKRTRPALVWRCPPTIVVRSAEMGPVPLTARRGTPRIASFDY